VEAVAQQGPALVEQGLSPVRRRRTACSGRKPSSSSSAGRLSRFGPNIYASMMRPAGARRATTPTA